ncbi:MAG: undecaprenyl-diphosphate phosphatase [Deltaproteobacteria bacterium]|jgi:undecaprenyl-diphosphatase|nr:undecaprenyl-diphosphate phosphatase [Deltaproteobacteria bacterium]
MTDWLASPFLGLIQGLGEFLPISSSGHLVLAQALIGLKKPELLFDLILHVATLGAICYFYRASLLTLLLELRLLPLALVSPAKMSAYFRLRPDFRLGLLIIIGSIPTGIIGLLFHDYFETLFASTGAVGFALLATAIFLTATRWAQPTKATTLRGLTIKIALAIGLIQGLAIIPGLSRSGLTIGLGILLGLEPALSARFSFLLSIPAILGGFLLTLNKSLATSFNSWEILAGFLVAAITGYLALCLLVRVIKPGRLIYFAPWCALVGLVAIFSHFCG